jgi:hypothetical protein
MKRMCAALGLSILLTPLAAFAFPFGGQASTVVPCYNQAIFARLGAPRGGDYIWTPATKTYQFGPPSFAGQWLLGLASAPYYCVVSIEPVIVWPGIAIDMMGSSGSSAPTVNQLLRGSAPTTAAPAAAPTYQAPTATPSPLSVQPTTIGHIVVSEVFYNVDSAHGTRPRDQWVELFNGSPGYVDVSGWTIQNASQQTVLPSRLTLAPAQFLVVLASPQTASFWNIPSTAKVTSLGASSIAGGFSLTADVVTLKNSSGTAVDSVSWGTNRSAFNPPIAASLSGYALARKGFSQDTNTASDWAASSIPSPGK